MSNHNLNVVIIMLEALKGPLEELAKSLEQNPSDIPRERWEFFCRLSDEVASEIHKTRRTVPSQLPPTIVNQNGKKPLEVHQGTAQRKTLTMYFSVERQVDVALKNEKFAQARELVNSLLTTPDKKGEACKLLKRIDLAEARTLCMESITARKLGKKVTSDELMVQVRRLLEPYEDGTQYVRATLAVHRVDRRITQETMAVFAI